MMNTGLVLYTDGGTHNNNPGPYGYGIHGYTYSYISPKKGIGLSGYVPTQLGYVKKTDKINEINENDDTDLISTTIPYSVTIESIINIHGSNDGLSTNNVAELLGMITGLEYILNHDFSRSVIYCDSEYVVKGINERLDQWQKNNYCKANNEEIANKEYWIRIYNLIQELKNKKIVYSIEWIKGHDKNPGNENADLLATIAANKSYQVNKGYIPVDQYSNTFDNTYFQDNLEIHPFLSSKRFYFNPYSDEKAKRDGIYYLGELGDKVEDIYIGKEISDAALSIVKINELDPVVELVKDIQIDWLNRHQYNLDTIVAGSLDVIAQKSTYNDLFKYKSDIVKAPERVRPDLFLLSQDKPITVVLDPPYLAMRTLEQFINLEERARQFLDNRWNQIAIDITDKLYQDKLDKKQNVIGKELLASISNTTKSISISDPLLDKKKITLTFGIDIPKRNTLKRLESLDPNVHLLVWKMDEHLFGYATIIVTKEREWGIWMASYSGNYLA